MEFFSDHALIAPAQLFWRLGVAAAFGMLMGIDREARGKSAGLRTHMLVALSSAMTMMIALELFEELKAQGRPPDPIRAIQGLAQAIGFLCAGVIFVARGNVYGLATAASLWMTSAVGIAAGAGMMPIALTGTLFALLILTALWLCERLIGKPGPPKPRPPGRDVEDGRS